MVAISSPAKVLVTGANGYLATWAEKMMYGIACLLKFLAPRDEW